MSLYIHHVGANVETMANLDHKLQDSEGGFYCKVSRKALTFF